MSKWNDWMALARPGSVAHHVAKGGEMTDADCQAVLDGLREIDPGFFDTYPGDCSEAGLREGIREIMYALVPKPPLWRRIARRTIGRTR